MIVSDYDDTFYLNDNDIKNNISLVNKFMIENIFCIATGRSYLDFTKKKEMYDIKFSYLIIDHGATILKDDVVIYNECIDNSIKDKLIKDLKLEETIGSFACSIKDSRVKFDDDNLTKIHVRYKSKDDAKLVNDTITDKYSDFINSFLVCKDEAIEIVSKKVNKSNAIRYVAKLSKVDENNIYTIGDSYSDIQMIKDFNGFAISNAILELKQLSIKEYDSVSDLIREVMHDQ